MTLPNKNNFCGGAFPDWLEINLLKQCNARCEWCIEKNGFHPKKVVDWTELCKKALATGQKNIILLGGEPTLYPRLQNMVYALAAEKRNVYITTNGSMLSREFVKKNLKGIKGVNVSIHDYDATNNRFITGLNLDLNALMYAIEELHNIGASVRFNCNCIKGKIDNVDDAERYIWFAQAMKADKVRFAELKQCNGYFVDLAKMFSYQYGLNDDPFIKGCNLNTVIDGMPVNFRQMCGLQTELRPMPVDPIQVAKQVLYYDGVLYDGWQQVARKSVMADTKLLEILKAIANGELTPQDALDEIERLNANVGAGPQHYTDDCNRVTSDCSTGECDKRHTSDCGTSGGCMY